MIFITIINIYFSFFTTGPRAFMKVAPISVLNLSASWSSSWLPSADLTAEVRMSLSRIRLAGGLGLLGDCLGGEEVVVGGAGVQGSHFSIVTSPGSGVTWRISVWAGPGGPSGRLKPGWILSGLWRNSLGVWVEKPGRLKAPAGWEECEGPAMKGKVR